MKERVIYVRHKRLDDSQHPYLTPPLNGSPFPAEGFGRFKFVFEIPEREDKLIYLVDVNLELLADTPEIVIEQLRQYALDEAKSIGE